LKQRHVLDVIWPLAGRLTRPRAAAWPPRQTPARRLASPSSPARSLPTVPV